MRLAELPYSISDLFPKEDFAFTMKFRRGEVPAFFQNREEAFVHASTMLERRNNGEIIKGGGLSARIGKRWVEDLGVSIEKAPSLKVHAVADPGLSPRFLQQPLLLRVGMILRIFQVVDR